MTAFMSSKILVKRSAGVKDKNSSNMSAQKDRWVLNNLSKKPSVY